jgi:predicted lipoprotein with Yx(FWY)xxD motif
MPRSIHRSHAGWAHRRLGLAAGLLGAGAAATLFAALASGSSFTLRIHRNVHVTNDPTKAFRVKAVDSHEAVATGPSGFAVYTFQGETTHHLLCRKTTSAKTNCWAFWPPVSVRAASGISKQKGIRGKLGTFHNHGTLQLTLNGRPLYYFTPDLQSRNKSQATGDELKTFGSVWHIVTAGGAANQGASTQPISTTPTTTTSNPYPSSSPYPYPY